MKFSRAYIQSKTRAIPELRFEEQSLTSYAGIVIFQKFFQHIKLLRKLYECFSCQKRKRSYGLPRIVMTMIVHYILGNRRLRELDYYRDDPLVKRILGVKKLPDVSTISRTLSAADARDFERLKTLNRTLVLERTHKEKIVRKTLDFDGTGLSTGGHAEGTAVGFNKKKKGARSYYPLVCTIAQTGQVLDWLDRPGNVHDSKGACGFMTSCFNAAGATDSNCLLESRVDSAFFSDEVISNMDNHGVEFSSSVPFERFPELKGMIENRKRWQVLNDRWSFFETDWKPRCWHQKYRFIFVRQRNRKIRKGPIQLDLFEPVDHEFTYKVIVTNKTCGAWHVIKYHNGRGTQEGIFGECKQHVAMDYIPFKRKLPNQIHLVSAILAHNLGREIQMQTKTRARGTTAKRAPLWIFDSLGTICRRLVQRAGRLTNQSGKLVLTMSANSSVREDLLHYLKEA